MSSGTLDPAEHVVPRSKRNRAIVWSARSVTRPQGLAVRRNLGIAVTLMSVMARQATATSARLACVLALSCCLLAGSAQAATVSLRVARSPGSKYAPAAVSVDVNYRAGGSETSSVRLSLAATRITIVDATTNVRALTGCRQVDVHAVTCDGPSDATDRAVNFVLGGGRDAFSFGSVDPDSGLVVDVKGGPMGNRIDGSNGTGMLVAEGGAGDDTLIGGPGVNVFSPGPGVNTIDGGTGTSVLDFSNARGPVHASLRDGTAIAPGERDTIRRVQNLRGSPYDDVLIGNDGPNTITGGGGNDVLVGLGGNDVLTASDPGEAAAGTRAASHYQHDVLFGGPGNNQLSASCADTLVGGPDANEYDLIGSDYCGDRYRRARPPRTQVFCTSPRDNAIEPNRTDVLIGCPRVSVSSKLGDLRGTVPPPHLTSHWAASFVGSSCAYFQRPCLERLTLTALRRGARPVTVGATTLHLPRGGKRTITATLTRRGRAYLRRHPNALVDVAIHSSEYQCPYHVDGEYLVPIQPLTPPPAP